MDKLRWGFVGCGNLSQALIRGVLSKDILDPNLISIIDRDPNKAVDFSMETEVIVSHDMQELITKSDILVLAVKPQDLGEAVASIKGKVSGKTILSVAAGVSTKILHDALGDVTPVVRVMANLPAQVGQGVFGILFSNCDGDVEAHISEFFGSLGFVLRVGSDKHIDAITSGSASGVGFVFSMMEVFESWFTKHGFSKQDARALTVHTFFGAAAFANQSERSLSDLREAVTSKKGTTEAGLNAMDAAKVATGLTSGLDAAVARALELSKSLILK